MPNGLPLSLWPYALALAVAFAVVLAAALEWSRRRSSRHAAIIEPIGQKTQPPRMTPPETLSEIPAQRPSGTGSPAQGVIPPARHGVPLSIMDRSRPADQDYTHAERANSPEPQAPVQSSRDVPDASRPGDAAQRCIGLLALAQSQLQAGSPPAAAGVLRDVIRLAAANGLNDHHAAARLELGELARQDGDLITACEHWQIARGLFHDLKNSARVKAVEMRMRDHGCPTDWVLNDF